MFVKHLSLSNFRNYTSLELELPQHITVLQGDNAQGKSNLLEAVCVLATTRSHRTSHERELINWSAFGDESAVCRLAATVHRAGRNVLLEMALRPGSGAGPETHSSFSSQAARRPTLTQKRIKVNGTVRRAMDFVGQVNVASFSVSDIDIIGGEPALRRRYLDVTISQVDPQYLRHLQRYQRVLTQRNRLLRLIAEKQASEEELPFWDEEMIRTGAHLVSKRRRFIDRLDTIGRSTHDELSHGHGALRPVYLSSIHRGRDESSQDVEIVSSTFAQALRAARHKEIAQRMSLVGPHRDDVRFLVNDIDMGVYGSRGEQRTIALSIKLAEARLMLEITGEHPVLLLDDVLSELDAGHRTHLLRAAAGHEQVLITATDLVHFEADFLRSAKLFKVVGGQVERLTA